LKLDIYYMTIDTTTIVTLRKITGAPMGDCRQALEEAGEDIDKAVEILRKKGILKAAKKSAQRDAREGLIDSYIHSNGKVGALVEMRCETDFVARNEEFRSLVHDVAMHVVAQKPVYVSPDEIPEEVIKKERDIYSQQLENEGKPRKIIDKIIEGKLEKYYESVCLLKQPFIKDDSMNIQELISEHITKMGEKIEVVGFSRFEIA